MYLDMYLSVLQSSKHKSCINFSGYVDKNEFLYFVCFKKLVLIVSMTNVLSQLMIPLYGQSFNEVTTPKNV